MFRRSEEVRRESWRLGERRIRREKCVCVWWRWRREMGVLSDWWLLFLETQLRLAEVQAEWFKSRGFKVSSKSEKLYIQHFRLKGFPPTPILRRKNVIPFQPATPLMSGVRYLWMLFEHQLWQVGIAVKEISRRQMCSVHERTQKHAQTHTNTRLKTSWENAEGPYEAAFDKVCLVVTSKRRWRSG